jgi:intracellular sulfur oxidation DsrE/DsrF family protein
MHTPLYRTAMMLIVLLFIAAPALAHEAKPLTMALAKAKPKETAKSKPSAKPHRIVIHVDQNDPAVMNLALNNATNLIDYYRSKGQDVSVDIVTYGPGLNMLRTDTSPVQDRVERLKEYAFPSKVQFSACGITRQNMEQKEGHPIDIVKDAVVVPSGVVHLMELQEKGWSYLRP